LQFDIANLSPWNDQSDKLILFSFDAGFLRNFFVKPALAGGATTLAGQLAFHGHRIDATKGDRATVVQLAQRNVGTPGSSYVAVDRAMTTASLSIAPGQTTRVAGTFDVLPMTHAAVDWRHGAFAALIPQMSPNAVNDGQTIDVYANLAPGAVNTQLLEYFVPDSSTDEHVPLNFGNPYPSSWSTTLTASVTIESSTMPGSYANAWCDWDLAALGASGAPLEPSIGPVQSPQIEGQNGFNPSQGVGTTPTLRWLPPLLGTPTSYQVDIRDLTPVVDNGITYDLPISIQTTEPTLRVMPGLLKPGHRYRVNIGASHEPPSSEPRNPYAPISYPRCVAEVVLGIVSP
jgi:hypothetical protein